MCRDATWGHGPFEENTEEPGDCTHEIDLETFSKARLEPLFDCIAGRIIDEVVYVASHIDGRSWEVGMVADEDTRVMNALPESHV